MEPLPTLEEEDLIERIRFQSELKHIAVNI